MYNFSIKGWRKNKFPQLLPFFDQKGFEILIHAFIYSKIDYCNALYTGITDYNLHLLQLIQNYAAKLVLNKRKFDHAKPLLRKLHWLPIKARIQYKALLICYKARNFLAPEYIQLLFTPYHRPSHLRNLAPNSLSVPNFELSSMGGRAFSVYTADLWNKLPSKIQTAQSVPVFKKLLKTHLFTLPSTWTYWLYFKRFEMFIHERRYIKPIYYYYLQ